jgi:hypothetical protein
MAGANDVRVLFADTIVAADTGDVRLDTVFTPAMDITDKDEITFYSGLWPYGSWGDTNWTDDSFFVKFQHSPDGKKWTTLAEIDTFLTTDSGWSTLLLGRNDSVLGNYGRGMLVHWDSIGVGEDDGSIIGNAYYKEFIFWILGN